MGGYTLINWNETSGGVYCAYKLYPYSHESTATSLTDYGAAAASQKTKIKSSSRREFLAAKRDGHTAKWYKTGNKFPLPAATNFMPINKMNYSAAHFLCSLLFPNPRKINYVKVQASPPQSMGPKLCMGHFNLFSIFSRNDISL